MKLAAIRDWYRARPGYWFRPKLLGLGVVPVTWQGWAATGGYGAAALVIALWADHRGPALFWLLVPLTLAFGWVAWTKTDGSWRWRWGPDGD